MAVEVIDKEFGKMIYDHRWEKKQMIVFFGINYEIDIIAKAFHGKEINDIQREKYKFFKENEVYVLGCAEEALTTYIEENRMSILNLIKENKVDIRERKIEELVKPRNIIFKKNGDFYMLCDCAWDVEEGLGIGMDPKLMVEGQDYFL